jgi:multidrug efflux pump subunit AcrA (membrane-fusion protein)
MTGIAKVVRAAPFLAAALFLTGCGGGVAEVASEPPLVLAATISPAGGEIDRYTGVIAPRIESALSFRVPGKMTERLVEVGQTVRAGQVLARLDPADLALGSATAAAQSAASGGQAAAAQRQVAAIEAEAWRSRAEEQRLRALLKPGFVSRQRYEESLARADAAAAQLAAAKAEADAARSQNAALRAAAGQASNQARYGTLTADADGVIIAVHAQPGQVVSAGQPVFQLARAGAREAVIAIPEARRAAVPRVAQAALYSAGQQSFSAVLRELSAAADPETRTFEARYVLEGAGAQAPLGATVTISTGTGGGALAVPAGAIHDRGSGPGVWVIDPGQKRVAFRRVSVASLGEEEVKIASGLRAGERVVALGAHLLREGQAVRTVGKVK